MSEKKTTITRKKVFAGDPESIGCQLTVIETGVVVNCPLWRSFMPGGDLTQEDFDKAKKSSLSHVQRLPASVVYWAVRGMSDSIGDTGNTTDETDVAQAMKERRDRIYAGEFHARTGGTDPRTELRETLLGMDAVLSGIMGKTAANKAAKDDSAKLAAKVAKKRGVEPKAYEASLDKRVSEALPA